MNLRLYGARKYKMPVPPRKTKNDKGFSLRTINEADSRYHVVKMMRQRVEKLMQDVDADTLQKEWLCARAVFITGYLESQEMDAIEGKKMEWRTYLQAVRSLTDVLNKLGLDKAVAGTKRLETYLVDARHKNGKRRSVANQNHQYR